MSPKIQFQCPVCRTTLQVAVEQAGSKINCPKCTQRLQVPRPDPEKTVMGVLPSLERPAAPQPVNAPVAVAAQPLQPVTAWHYRHAGASVGPISWAEMQQRAAAGKIGPADLVWTQGMPQWVRADSVQHLFAPVATPASVRSSSASRFDLSALQARVVKSVKGSSPLVWAGVGGGVVAVVGLFLVVAVLVIGWLVRPSTPANLTSDAIFARHAKSVAVLRTSHGSGSGFLVGPGLVATNAHVIDDGTVDQLKVHFPSAENGKGPLGVDAILVVNRKDDLALLRVKSELPPLTVAEQHAFQPGQSATAIGSPGFGEGVLENAVSTGVLSTRFQEKGRDWYQLNMAINPGNSGGPLFDNRGRVIGVVVAKATKQEALAFAVSCARLTEAISQAKKMSEEEARKATVNQDLAVAFQRIAQAGSLYAVHLKITRDRLNDPRSRNQTAGQIIAASRKDFDEFLEQKGLGNLETFNRAMMEDVKPTLTRLGQDPDVSRAVYDEVFDLWKNYLALKSHSDQPGRMTVTEYLDHSTRLTEKHSQLANVIRVRLGMDEID